MMKMTKIFLLAVALFALTMPSASWAAFDPVYGIDPDSIAWTNYEEVSLDGATFAYHVWYDDGVTRADYYAAYYDTYMNEYLLYDGPTQDQALGASSAYDSSWTRNRELIGTDDVYLEYTEYNDGAYYYYDLIYDDDANNYEYEESRETLPSGAYDYYYRYWTEDLQWNYSAWYDTSDGTTGLSYYYFDPVAGTEYGHEEWNSTQTSSYSIYDFDRSGTWEDMGSYWEFDYEANGTESSYYESFSADYSSFASSFEQRTYSPTGDTYYSQWDYRTTDTSYYATGYEWDDNVNDDWESYYDSFAPDWGDKREIYFGQGHDGEDYYSSYSYYFEEYVGGDLYTYTDWDYDGDYRENYYYQKNYDPDNNGEFEESYTYDWYNTGSPDPYTARYRENAENRSYDNGYFYNYYYEYARDWTTSSPSSESYGSGYRIEQRSEYDPSIQETDFYYDYETYAKDRSWFRTYDYYYSERVLADSDQRNVYWSLYNRDAETGNDLNTESYSYNLNSDTRDEYWSYNYNDYEPDNDTYFNEQHWKNLGTGAYNDYASYRVSGISEEWTQTGMDLDYYWSNYGGEDYVEDYRYSSNYSLKLANGNGHFEQYYYDYGTTGNEWRLNLNYLVDHWEGRGLLDYASGTTDLYLYTDYPGDYFLVEDFDPIIR